MTKRFLLGMAWTLTSAALSMSGHAPGLAAAAHSRMPESGRAGGVAKDAGSAAAGVPGKEAPQPGQPQYQGDWAAGCDNLLRCEAIALRPETGGVDDAGEPMLVQIVRSGGAEGEVLLRVSGLSALPPEMALIVDGRPTARLLTQSDEAVIRGAEALQAVQAMASAISIELRVAGRKNRGAPTLLSLSSAGLAESLRFVDTRQGRTGTATAFIARGTGTDTGVPLPPAIPVVPQLPVLDGDAATALDAGELAAARRLAVCDAMLKADGLVELFALGEDSALVLLPCEAGAYNVSAVPLIAHGKAGARTVSVARFDFAPGFTGEPGKPPLVVNALWDARRGILSSLAKGRGVGDCGASENYVWDGTMFRLIESRAMHVCRGAWEWIRLWEAQPQMAAAPNGTSAEVPPAVVPR
ncbi:MAG: DUF1176 domain-containing protein [Sphingobium sp.]